MEVDTEDGKEILLGNKQLLSIFFVVVILLGIAFTIGYTIGKNTATIKAADGISGSTTAGSARGNASDRSDNPTPPVPDDSSPRRLAPDTAAAVPETPPRLSSTAPATTHPAAPYEGTGAGNTDRDSGGQQTSTESPVPQLRTATAAVVSAGGPYLQVGALKREDADNISRVLRTRGYPVVLGESSKEGLFRVLVGPYKNMADLAEAKGKLRASGMDSFVVR